MKRAITFLLTIVMVVSLLAGCSAENGSKDNEKGGNNASQTNSEVTKEGVPEPVTLKVLLSGDKPNQWDLILEEFYNRTKDTLNITFDWQWVPSSDYKDKLNVKMTAGEQYDLVFDAPWMNLRTLSEDGAYVDLKPYLNNDAYPGLKDAFPEEIMKFNKFSEMNTAFPLFFTYKSVDVVMYRQDWAKNFGIGENGQITSKEELEQYLQKVQAEMPKVIPMILKDNRGFYRLTDGLTSEQNKEHIYMGSLGQDVNFAYKLNDDETEVIATALQGDPAEYWEPFGGVDYWKQKVETNRDWNKYAETDSLNQADPGTVFQIGKAAAHIEGIDAFPKFSQALKNNDPNAELGVFIIEDGVRNMEKGLFSAQVTSSNFVAIPASSKKVERTIAFLNWLFESKENHDLFEYGIEGKNWEAIGDNQYKLPDGVDSATNYNTNGWNLSWHPKFYRFSSEYSDYAVQYAKYAATMDNFVIKNNSGFSFKADNVKTEITQCGAILEKVSRPLAHGILDNPYEALQDVAVQMRQNGVQKGIDEYVKQLNEHLKEQAAENNQ